MSKPSSATAFGLQRKSKWNREFIEKRISPLMCTQCKTWRNKFLKDTPICALCAMKLSKRADKRTEVKKV